VVLEGSDAVGGRVRSDVVDGFTLDRGFQVLLTAYPEVARALDVDALDLRTFSPGALVQRGVGAQGRVRIADPLRAPSTLWQTLTAPVGTLADKLRIARLRARTARGTLSALWERPETTALELLRAEGFSDDMIEGFLRPWLGGVFLDDTLTTSSRMLEFVFRMFAQGDTAVPARGMQAIPNQLAAHLPADCVQLHQHVVHVDSAIHGARVTTRSGHTWHARDVVIAVEGAQAHALLPEVAAPTWRGCTTLWFAADASPVHEGTLVLSGMRSARGLVNHVVVHSDVAPTYAPAGQSLVCVSVLGVPAENSDTALATTVQRELASWFDDDVHAWRLLRVQRIPHALPVRAPLAHRAPLPLRRAVWLCGDHTASASIQGALQSGRVVAEALLEARGHDVTGTVRARSS
jgi:phytoene dehydrogenase-like protein